MKLRSRLIYKSGVIGFVNLSRARENELNKRECADRGISDGCVMTVTGCRT
ncbi:hypothetical protein QUF80_19405 [Desulfococcaceae bacterium HSG8]|nr:hypothetical protein [Desulfococcaceae bacterium HSG8]